MAATDRAMLCSGHPSDRYPLTPCHGALKSVFARIRRALLIVQYVDYVDWTATVTAIGTLLGGLALPLAFIQLGALRQDRLRAQINKVGVWPATPEKVRDAEQGQSEWKVSLNIRNSSELPVGPAATNEPSGDAAANITPTSAGTPTRTRCRSRNGLQPPYQTWTPG
jgi:hypothetical protein